VLTRGLITGGTGFLGRHLAHALSGMGWAVTVTRRPGDPAHPQPWALPQAGCQGKALEPHPTRAHPQSLALPPGVAVVEVALTDPDAVADLIRAHRPQVLFHLAARTEVARRLDLLRPMLQDNVVAGGIVLEAAARAGIPRLVWVGTCEEYGDGPVPFREDQVPRPVSPYSCTKLAGSLLAQSAARTLDVPVVVVRPFLTYGPGQAPTRFIPQAIAAALEQRPFPMTSGEQTRDLLFAEDTVQGLIAAATAEGIVGELLNLSSGREVALREVVRAIFRIAQAPESLIAFGALAHRPAESMRFFGDPARAQRVMGWHASVDLETGLRKTIDWYRAQGGWAFEVAEGTAS